MRRIKADRHRSATVYNATLFRNDLEDLINWLKDASLKVKIADGEYEYDSLDDFVKHHGVIPDEIEIEGESENFDTVTLSVDVNEITASCYGTPDTVSVWFQLMERISSRSSGILGVIVFSILVAFYINISSHTK